MIRHHGHLKLRNLAASREHGVHVDLDENDVPMGIETTAPGVVTAAELSAVLASSSWCHCSMKTRLLQDRSQAQAGELPGRKLPESPPIALFRTDISRCASSNVMTTSISPERRKERHRATRSPSVRTIATPSSPDSWSRNSVVPTWSMVPRND
jgi:hypothetical protein